MGHSFTNRTDFEKKIRQYFKSHQNFFFASSSKMNRHVYQDFVEKKFFSFYNY